jgi:high-affinity iron transporter
MITTAIIAFREFLEAFLIVGVFLGVSRKMHLKKEVEITLAAATGMFLSLLLITATYFFTGHARSVLTEQNADFMESFLLIFSGFFISYVVFSLHAVIGKSRHTLLKSAQNKMGQNVFDISLFLTIVFLVLREGFEIALFTVSVSLLSAFMQNVAGLFIGFFLSCAVGILTYYAYISFPLKRVFVVTEYMIILLGASLVQNGFTKLLQTRFHILLSGIVPFHLQFLPSEDSFLGNFLQSFFGIDSGFSLTRLSIMIGYVMMIYVLFLRKSADPEE